MPCHKKSRLTAADRMHYNFLRRNRIGPARATRMAKQMTRIDKRGK